MQFLKSEVHFKAIARALEGKFRDAPVLGRVSPEIVLDVFRRFPGVQAESHFSERLVDLLDRFRRC